MKTIAACVLGLGLLGWVGLAQSQEKKGEAPKLEGKWTLVSGKVNGNPVGDEAKKSTFTFTGEKMTIKGGDITFVMGYKLDAKTDPVSVDMEILEGPEGTKGSKAQGIIELKGDTLKLAYTMEKEKRPKDFKGEKDNMFEFQKAK